MKLQEVPPENSLSAATPPNPSQRVIPPIPGDDALFIHGHSSSAETVLPWVGPLPRQADNRDRQLTLTALDLPSNGYTS